MNLVTCFVLNIRSQLLYLWSSMAVSSMSMVIKINIERVTSPICVDKIQLSNYNIKFSFNLFCCCNKLILFGN